MTPPGSVGGEWGVVAPGEFARRSSEGRSLLPGSGPSFNGESRFLLLVALALLIWAFAAPDEPEAPTASYYGAEVAEGPFGNHPEPRCAEWVYSHQDFEVSVVHCPSGTHYKKRLGFDRGYQPFKSPRLDEDEPQDEKGVVPLLPQPPAKPAS